MTLPFDIDFEVNFSGAKSSEGDGVTAAELEEAAAACCGNPLGCSDAPVETAHQEDPHGAR